MGKGQVLVWLGRLLPEWRHWLALQSGPFWCAKPHILRHMGWISFLPLHPHELMLNLSPWACLRHSNPVFPLSVAWRPRHWRHLSFRPWPQGARTHLCEMFKDILPWVSLCLVPCLPFETPHMPTNVLLSSKNRKYISEFSERRGWWALHSTLWRGKEFAKPAPGTGLLAALL